MDWHAPTYKCVALIGAGGGKEKKEEGRGEGGERRRQWRGEREKVIEWGDGGIDSHIALYTYMKFSKTKKLIWKQKNRQKIISNPETSTQCS